MTDQQGDTNFIWSSIFFQSLQQIGIRHIVISPGSRSTPLTLAVATNEYFEKHVILDERSAAFTALGIGKSTNTPAVLISTSGTAVANYYPAVIEARLSGIPIILATADRPPHLRATGANQAIDQLKMFGDYPVFFHEVGEPQRGLQDRKRVSLLARQAVSNARTQQGPVHLNFAFRKPLEPETGNFNKLSAKAEEFVDLTDQNSIESQPNITLSAKVLHNLSQAKKPLIIVGPLAPGDQADPIAKLADKLQAPILSESTVNHSNNIKHFAGFLRNQQLRQKLEPDFILRFGFQPTTKSIEKGLQDWNVNEHLHFASTDQWQDATFANATRIEWRGYDIDTDRLTSSTDDNWLERWRKAQREFNNYYNTIFDTKSELTDGAIYDRLIPQIPEDTFLMVSNSFPARDLHLFGKWASDIQLFQNRGASGIDGITSTAVGLGLGLEKPGILFTGDLAFLHDTNALLNHEKLQYPIVIIVINNSGGSIFRMLPIADHEEYFNSYFETPQSVSIKKLVESYNIPSRKITSLSELREFRLSNWMSRNNSLSVIECQTDADASMELRNQLWNF